MRYIKTFENIQKDENREYQYYIAIYMRDCESTEDMIMRAKLLKNFLKHRHQNVNKICYIDPTFFPNHSECIVFFY